MIAACSFEVIITSRPYHTAMIAVFSFVVIITSKPYHTAMIAVFSFSVVHKTTKFVGYMGIEFAGLA